MGRLWLLLMILVTTAAAPRSSSFIDSGSWDISETAQAQEQSSPTQSGGKPQADERGTEKAPLAVKLLNTGQSETEAAQEAKRVAEKEGFDKWSAKWTIGLTIALVGATVLQFGALIYQGYWIRRSVAVAEKVVTDLERPWLFVTVNQTLSIFPGLTDRQPAVVFTVFNGGRFPAEIIECSADFVQSNVPVNGIVRDALHTIISPTEPLKDLRLAATDPFNFELRADLGPNWVRVPIQSNDYETFFVINIRYRGLGKDIYISDFSWRWDHAIDSWGSPHRRRT